jgi:integrase
MSEKDFDKANRTRPRGEHKEAKAKLEAYLKRAESAKESLSEWSYDEFKKRFKGGQTDNKEIFSRYRTWIIEEQKRNKIGNARNIRNAYNQLRKFHKKKELFFNEVSLSWLRSFERWIVSKGSSPRTAGIYLQTLRTVFNDALHEGIITKSPFGERGYSIPKSAGLPRALKADELARFWHYETDNIQEQEAQLYFKLIYLWSGINLHDLFALRWKDIQGESLIFQRGKTKSKTNKVIQLPVNDEVRFILRALSTTEKEKEYILPVYIGTKTDQERELKKRNKTSTLNKFLKRIGLKLGFSVPLTSYVARHTYATLANRLGVPLSYIQDSLGHTNIKTTQNYLDKFEDEKAKEFQNLLSPKRSEDHGERATDE